MGFFSWFTTIYFSISFTRTVSLFNNLAILDKYALQNFGFFFSCDWGLVNNMSELIKLIHIYIKSHVKVCWMFTAEQYSAQYFCFSET